MSSRIRFVLGEIARYSATLVVLGGLAALWLLGSRYDWKLPPPGSWGRTEEKAEKSEKESDEPRDSSSVVLASERTAKEAGFEHAHVSEQQMARYVEAPAVLDFKHAKHARLAPRAAGTAWRVFASAGQAVKKGDVLALVSAPELGSAKAELLTAHIQYEIRNQTLARLHSVGNAVPERQLRDAELSLREAKVRLANAQDALVNLSLPLRLTDLQNQSDEQIARRIHLLGLPTYLAEDERLPGNLLPLAASFDGIIIRCDMVAGEVVSPTHSAFELADVRRLWVQMDVRLEDIGHLRLGQSVEFSSRATGRSVSGSLIWISAEVDPKTRTVRARAEVDNSDGKARPATYGVSRIQIGRNAAALTVPDEALQYYDGAYRVFVRHDEKTYFPRIALPGVRAEGRAEMLDPWVILGPELAGALAGNLSALPALSTLAATRQMFLEVRPGEEVATTGSHVLKSEQLKHRIKSED